MTAKESEQLKTLTATINLMSVKLFGNGSKNGCIDDRLEHVETYISELRDIMPKMVTEDSCSKRHAVRWSRIVLTIGLTATWAGLALKAMEVL